MQDYLKTNLASINLEDSEAETLYKMYESAKHINSRIAQFQKQEDAFYQVIKKYKDLPELVKGFDQIPAQLEQDEQFLSMIEGQFQMLYEQIQASIQKGAGP